MKLAAVFVAGMFALSVASVEAAVIDLDGVGSSGSAEFSQAPSSTNFNLNNIIDVQNSGGNPIKITITPLENIIALGVINVNGTASPQSGFQYNQGGTSIFPLVILYPPETSTSTMQDGLQSLSIQYTPGSNPGPDAELSLGVVITPVPAALPLMLTALAGLGLTVRRSRSRKA